MIGHLMQLLNLKVMPVNFNASFKKENRRPMITVSVTVSCLIIVFTISLNKI